MLTLLWSKLNNFWFPKNLATNSLLLARNLTDNRNHRLVSLFYVIYIIYSILNNKVSWKNMLLRKSSRGKNTFTAIYHIFIHKTSKCRQEQECHQVCGGGPVLADGHDPLPGGLGSVAAAGAWLATGGDNSLELQYSCLICLQLYHGP